MISKADIGVAPLLSSDCPLYRWMSLYKSRKRQSKWVFMARLMADRPRSRRVPITALRCSLSSMSSSLCAVSYGCSDTIKDHFKEHSGIQGLITKLSLSEVFSRFGVTITIALCVVLIFSPRPLLGSLDDDEDEEEEDRPPSSCL